MLFAFPVCNWVVDIGILGRNTRILNRDCRLLDLQDMKNRDYR